jgi:hypothetical protein
MSSHSGENNQVVYPVVVIEVCGISIRGLLDTGSGSCCESAKLIDTLNKPPKIVQMKRIRWKMVLGATTTNVETHSATNKAINGGFTMEVGSTKVHKPHLMEIDDQLLDAHELRRVLRICTCIQRFLFNCKNPVEFGETVY